MKKTVFLFLTTITALTSCNSKKHSITEIAEPTRPVTQVIDEPKKVEEDINEEFHSDSTDGEPAVERFYPASKTSETVDTLIQEYSLKISITQSSLDTYVVDEYESDGVKYSTKYRDNENHLLIVKNDIIVMDTVFTKETFSEFMSSDFLEIAQFHRYWLREIKDDQLEFFGVITKPDTDWSFAFSHYLDLASLEFKVEEYIDEDI